MSRGEGQGPIQNYILHARHVKSVANSRPVFGNAVLYSNGGDAVKMHDLKVRGAGLDGIFPGRSFSENLYHDTVFGTS